ncbi:MAG TPA: hypothetical protein VF317_06615 [Dermatophilaceae bacterium]
MSELRQLEVPADWVASRDLGGFPTLFGYGQKPADVREMQGSVMIVFPQLEDEADSIYAVPGVLDWFHELYDQVPHFPYFLVPHPLAGGLQSLIMSGGNADLRAHARQTGNLAADDEVQQWLLSRMVATGRYATHMADDWERIVREFLGPAGPAADAFVEKVRQQVE